MEDPVIFWVNTIMIVGIAIALIGGYFLKQHTKALRAENEREEARRQRDCE